MASTQIAFVSTRSGNKEIWAMDYDGANQHQLTSLHSIALTPRWSPDADRIAFTCYPTAGSILSAQICVYSTVSSRLLNWPRYRGTNSSPAWSPDGTKIMFMSSMLGNPELFISRGGRQPSEAADAFDRRGYFGGVESENGAAGGLRQRPRRHSAALYHGRGRQRGAEGGAAGHGLRDRSGVVAERAIAGLQLAAAERQL